MKHGLALVTAVFVGGMCGTTLRWLFDAMIPNESDGFPLGTLLVNVVGAFLLGLVVARLWPRSPAWLRAGLGSGLLGSFTTFSAVMISLVSLGAQSQWWVAVAYLVASLVLGLSAAALGLHLGKPAESIDWVDE